MAENRTEVEILLDAVNEASSVVDRVRRSLTEIDAQQRQAEETTRKTERSWNVLDAVSRRLTATWHALNNAGRRLVNGVRQVGAALASLFGTISRLLAPLAAFLTLWRAFAEVKSTATIAARTAEIRSQLAFLLGTGQEAARVTRQLQQLTTSTPFDLEKLTRMTTTLIAMTRGVVDLGEAMMLVSDASVATGADVTEVSRVFGQTIDRIIRGTEMEVESLKGVLEAGDVQVLKSMRQQGAAVQEQIDFVLERFRRFQGATAIQQETFAGLLGTSRSWLDLLRFQFGEVLTNSLIPSLSELNTFLAQVFESGRVAEWGRQFSAAVLVVVDSVANGRLSRLLSLAFQVAFDESVELMRRAFEGGFRTIFGRSLLIIAAEAGVKLVDILMSAVGVPVDYLSAGLVWAASKFEIAMRKTIDVVTRLFDTMINAVVSGINTVILTLNSYLDKLPGGKKPGFDTLSPVNLGTSLAPGAPEISFDAALQGTRATRQAAQAETMEYLRAQVEQTRQILDLETGAVEARRELNALWQEQLAAVDAATEAAEVRQATLATGGGTSPGLETKESVFNSTLEDFVDSLGNSSTRTAEVLNVTLGGAIDGVADSLTGVITKTRTWGEVWLNVGQAIIGTIIKIGVQMLAQWVLEKTINQMRTTDTVTQSSTRTAAYSVEAATKSATDYGIGAAIGTAVAIAAILAAIAALSGAFAEGGLIPGAPSSKDNRIAAVATGEFIIPANIVSKWGPEHFEAYRQGKNPFTDGGHIPAPVHKAAFADGGLVTPGSGMAGATNFNVGIISNRQEEREFMLREGRRVILNDLEQRGRA